MKFHKLNITAFGPFSDKAQIDFSDLGENPLFLIDGPTGAGKSSILHAICYALYGETTDADRKELGLRCDHAESDLLTALCLEFSIRGQHYRITREPTQMRPAKRGDGETEQKATAHLSKLLEDGTEETLVAKKKSEADAKIKAIIGLSADQFRQVMVLPQGKFRELLLAKSDDRQEILSTLFQTEIYKRIEQILKDKSGDIERQYKDFEKSKQEALIDAHVADWDALTEAFAQSKVALQHCEDTKVKADKLRQAAADKVKSAQAVLSSFNARSKKQDEQRQHQLQSDNIDAQRLCIARAEKAASIKPQWQNLQIVTTDITVKNDDISNANKDELRAKQRVAKATEVLDNAKQQYNQRDQLKEKETQLVGFRNKLAGYETIKSDSAKADIAHEQVSSRKIILTKQISDIDNAIVDHIAEQNRLSLLVSQKTDVFSQEIEAKRRFDNRTKLQAANTELTALNEAVISAQQRAEEADAVHKKAEKEADRLEMLWFNSQAAVLAKKLQENQPCQVCGSLEHPSPAVFAANAEQINQDTVDQARKRQAQCLHLRIDADNKMTACQRNVVDKQIFINALKTDLGEYAQRTAAELKQAFTEISTRLKTIEAAEKALTNNANAQQLKENQRAPVQIELKQCEAQLPVLLTAKVKASSELATAENSLPEHYRSLQVLEQAIKETSTTITQIENAYVKAQKAQQDAQTAHTTVVSTLTSLNNELIKLSARQAELQKQWLQVLASSDFANQADFAKAQLDATAVEQIRMAVRTFDDTARDIKAALAVMDQQLNDQKMPELERLQQDLTAAEIIYKAAEDEWINTNNHKAMLQRAQDKIQQLNQQQSKVKRQFEVIGKMSKAASGRGEVRVSLERFVLGNLLDSVLSIASQRLHIMSKGQYRLIRQDESNQRKTATAGLDLAIDDAYSGKPRPVATLSGGESFLASLALALALSDVVQQRSGGIQLDTLFIDEGFGSLDEDSLQLAINTLVELQSTGRTIGIISHVSELKEQIPQRIDVTRTRSGSKVKTVPA